MKVTVSSGVEYEIVRAEQPRHFKDRDETVHWYITPWPTSKEDRDELLKLNAVGNLGGYGGSENWNDHGKYYWKTVYVS